MALAVDRSKRHIVTGYGTALQVHRVGDDGTVGAPKTLALGRGAKNSFSITDVKWEIEHNTVAVATNSGSVVVKNLAEPGARSQRDLNGHKQWAVNSVAWQPGSGACVLASGAQDKLVKVWDVRTATARTTIDPRCQSIRDLQFNPHEPHHLAVAFETGYIHLWDMRSLHNPCARINAHTGYVLSIDWHPTQRSWMASASTTDKAIAVWDFGRSAFQNRDSALSIIPTHAPPASIRWRPTFEKQLGACYGRGNSWHLWDMDEPFVPLAVIECDDDETLPAFDFLSLPESAAAQDETWALGASRLLPKVPFTSVLTLSHAGKLRIADLKKARRPRELLTPSTLSLSPDGMAAASFDTVRLDPVGQGLERIALRGPGGSSSDLSAGVEKAIAPATNPVPARQLPFVPMAKAKSTPSLAHSDKAQAALKAARTTSAEHWDDDRSKPSATLRIYAPDAIFRRDNEVSLASVDDFSASSFEGLARGYHISGGSPVQLCEHNARAAEGAGEYALAQMWSALGVMCAEGAHDAGGNGGEEAVSKEGPSMSKGAQGGRTAEGMGGAESENKHARLGVQESSAEQAEGPGQETTPDVLPGSESPSAVPQGSAMLRKTLRESQPEDAAKTNGTQNPRQALDVDEDSVAAAPGVPPKASPTQQAQGRLRGQRTGQKQSERESAMPQDTAAPDDGEGSADGRSCEKSEGRLPGEPATAGEQRGQAAMFFEERGPGEARTADAGPAPSASRSTSLAADATGRKDSPGGTEFCGGRSGSEAAGQGSSGQTGPAQRQKRSEGMPERWMDTALSLVEDFLRRGDVQHCVVLTEVLELVRPGVVRVTREMLREWTHAYINLLRRLHLNDAATEIINGTSDDDVRLTNEVSTGVHTSCMLCRRPQLTAGRRCLECSATITSCVLCHQPVSGLYVWCPGCGHGGHAACLERWFAEESTCPSGCGHQCELKSHSGVEDAVRRAIRNCGHAAMSLLPASSQAM